MTSLSIPGLDTDAWSRWVAYRIAIRKPLKEISLHAAALKLSQFGADQAKVVEQSIANQWQGLFALNKPKADPHAPKERTSKERDADAARFEYMNRESAKAWDLERHTPIGKLKLIEATLARYDVLDDGTAIWAEKREWLKEIAAATLREADAMEVLSELTCWRLVLRLYSGAGLNRLRQRAAV